MFNAATTLLASFSLGLLCAGFGYYTDLHLGYEFVPTTISLEAAAVFISVALSRSLSKLDLNAFSLVAICTLIASCFLLLAINYVSIASHFIAMLCVIAPVIFTGILVAINANAMTTRFIIILAIVGFCAGVAVSSMVMGNYGLWMVFVLSFAAQALAIMMMVNVTVMTKASALSLFVAMTVFINNDSMSDRLAIWSLSDGPVSKSSLYTLYAAEKQNMSIDRTTWGSLGRADIVSTGRSRNDGYSWVIYNANNAVPFVSKGNSTISWWVDHYPLLILPFELKSPLKVLTVSAGRGPDADIAQGLYSAETESIYRDCVSLNSIEPCNDSSVRAKLENAFTSHKHYDLVSFSIPNQTTSPYVGASASHEAIHTMESFHKYYDSLDDNGLMAITTRDQVMLFKTLSYVWHELSSNDNEKIANFEDRIRVLMLNKYALYKDTYNYLVLLSKSPFTSEQLSKIDAFVATSPVTRVIYDSTNNEPPYIMFKQLDKITVSDAVSHLTSASSWKYKKLVNLEPSTTVKPVFFHLTYLLHPFVSTLSALFLLLGIYGLLMSQPSIRRWGMPEVQYMPVFSILLFQSFLTTLAFIFVLYAIVTFASASLGYSSLVVTGLMIVALATYAASHAYSASTEVTQKGFSGIWFYFASLLICVATLIILAQHLDTLLDVSTKLVLYFLTIMIALCSGRAHSQAMQQTQKFYPGTWFWFWFMASVGAVLGTIIAKYLLIEYDLDVIVLTAMSIIILSAIIAWWCLAVIMDGARLKADSLKAAG